MIEEEIVMDWSDTDKREPKFTRPELLVHPQIPRMLHGFNPRTLMGNRWWHKNRWEAFKENNHCCWACGVHRTEAWKYQWLEGHECYRYMWEEGRLILEEIVGLCFACHSFIHDGHLAAMCMGGKITRAEENYVRKRGHDILQENDLLSERATRHLGGWDHAPWEEWVMVVEGQEFSLEDFRRGGDIDE